MNPSESNTVVITGIGMVTPLGNDPATVLRGIQTGARAAGPPGAFDPGTFDCPVCAAAKDFSPQAYVTEPKLIRLMNRDAQLAVAAARLALRDAGVKPGSTHPGDQVGLFGATGLAGLPLGAVTPLIRMSTGQDGGFDLARFGEAGLKAVSPILSFKILSNMPLCFVSINEQIQGANAIYTPWEGDGARAIEAAIRAVRAGNAACALVGGCDVKTHELAFATLQQRGLFNSWAATGQGMVPGEGAVFLVLETAAAASARGARVHARLGRFGLRPSSRGETANQARVRVLSGLDSQQPGLLVSSVNAESAENDERAALERAGVRPGTQIRPKPHAGDLFAAAAALQVGLGAVLAAAGAGQVLANCFGYGRTQAAFVLESP